MTVRPSRLAGLGIASVHKDDASGREKEHDHDQDRNDGPGELDLIAAVDLRGLAVGVRRPMAEADQGIEQQSGDDEKDGQCDGKHQHGKAEGGMRRGAGGIEDVRGRLCGSRARDQRHAADRTAPDACRPRVGSADVCGRTSGEKRHGSRTSIRNRLEEHN